jgi:hypothetical protein
MGFTALPALQLLRSGFDPRTMRLNWCCVPRYHHHRTPGFGQNDAVAVILDHARFPWFQHGSWQLWLSADRRRAKLPTLDRNVGNEALRALHEEHDASVRRAQRRAARGAANAAAGAAVEGMTQAMMLSLPTTVYQPPPAQPQPQQPAVSEGDPEALPNAAADAGGSVGAAAMSEADAALCSICYEVVDPGSRIFAMQCSHVQHYGERIRRVLVAPFYFLIMKRFLACHDRLGTDIRQPYSKRKHFGAFRRLHEALGGQKARVSRVPARTAPPELQRGGATTDGCEWTGQQHRHAVGRAAANDGHVSPWYAGPRAAAAWQQPRSAAGGGQRRDNSGAAEGCRTERAHTVYAG